MAHIATATIIAYTCLQSYLLFTQPQQFIEIYSDKIFHIHGTGFNITGLYHIPVYWSCIKVEGHIFNIGVGSTFLMVLSMLAMIAGYSLIQQIRYRRLASSCVAVSMLLYMAAYSVFESQMYEVYNMIPLKVDTVGLTFTAGMSTILMCITGIAPSMIYFNSN